MTQNDNKPDVCANRSFNNPTGDWDGLIYTFCYTDKDYLANGFHPTYCIESWGKDNTLMLMELFEDYNYSITVRKHVLERG